MIDENLYVTDIVRADYRTADVFTRYGIDFCCGGKWPLKTACELNGVNIDAIKKELEDSQRTINCPNILPFDDWDIDFLTAYIVNVHHFYLRTTLPQARRYLEDFTRSHQNKFPYLPEVLEIFVALSNEMLPHMVQEETIIFPYIGQISHAYHSKESYAGLLVRTLRKPIENVMMHEHESVTKQLQHMRQLTSHYSVPDSACVSHRVTFSKLLELDNDLVQHMHLENDILFPRAIAMEAELLERKN